MFLISYPWIETLVCFSYMKITRRIW